MNIQKIVLIVAIMSIVLTLPAAASVATVSVGNATTVGSTVTVPINVSGAPDIGAMTVTLEYDSSMLSATGVSKGAVTANALLITEGTVDSGVISDDDNETVWNSGAIIGDITDNRVNICMISTSGFSGDGLLVEITFTKVAGGTCPLTLSATANETASCGDDCTSETVFDSAYYPEVVIESIDGEYVSEVGELTGDTNGDGKVDMDELFVGIDAYMAGTADMDYLFGAINAYMATA